jgi:hypothetical protein
LKFLWDVLTFVLAGLSSLTPKLLAMTLCAGLSMALLCAIGSSHYTRLWNKHYRVSAFQKLLTVFAAVASFIFVITFMSFASFNEVVDREIAAWATQLKSDEAFAHQAYQQAYYAVKSRNLEDFSSAPPPEQGGTKFPVTSAESRRLTGEIYADEAYMSFSREHPFFSLVILEKSRIPSESLKTDMDRYFAANPGKSYSAGTGIELAASIIRDGLLQRSPRLVLVARILLAIAFFVVQVACFGVIGLAAYRDLKVTT